MKSKCCDYKLKVVSGRRTSFYMCELCHKPSDPKEWSDKTIKTVGNLRKRKII